LLALNLNPNILWTNFSFSVSASRTRVIVRDMTGKYTWDNYLFFESIEKLQSHIQASSISESINSEPENPVGLLDLLCLSDGVFVEENPRVCQPFVVIISFYY